MTATLPVVEHAAGAGDSPGTLREAGIRANVLDLLGRPAALYRVAVVPLWGDHFRVNVITGADPTAVQIPHSFFVSADRSGVILSSTPAITKLYGSAAPLKSPSPAGTT